MKLASVSSGTCCKSQAERVDQRSHTDVYINQCLLCNQAFTQSVDLYWHMSQHRELHNTVGQGFLLDSVNQSDGTVGQRVLVSSDSKMNSLASQKFNSDLNAEFMGKTSQQKSVKYSVNLPSNVENQENLQRPYRCEICLRDFAHKHNLNRHKMSHNSKTHKCDICGRSFKEEFYLQMHLKIHSEETAAPCEICGMTVKREEVWTHMNGHYKSIVKNPSYEEIGHRVRDILHNQNS